MSISRFSKSLALCALITASAAQAQGGPYMGRGMMDSSGPRMMWGVDDTCPMGGSTPYMHGYPWRMNLTDDQRKQADEIFDRARTRSRALQEQMAAAQARLRDALNNPKRDRTEIMNAWRETEALRARNFENNLDAQLEFDRVMGK
jgi:Spy/CpxP family protein refolding chaperone